MRYWPPVEPLGLDKKARKYRILSYQRINYLQECKLALVSGSIVNASLHVTDQWDNAKNGVIEMPAEGTETTGTHGIRIVAYSDPDQSFKFANIWGTSWGDQGFGTLPYEYFEHLLIEAYISAGTGVSPPGGGSSNECDNADFLGENGSCRSSLSRP